MPNTLYKQIGINVKNSRDKRRITQEDLSDKVGLTRTSIVHIEKGEQKLPIDRLYKIAEVLKVSPLDLLPDTNETSGPIDLISKKRISKKTEKEVLEIISMKTKGVKYDKKNIASRNGKSHTKRK